MSAPTMEQLEAAADWLDEAADGWSAERKQAFLAWLSDDPMRLEAVNRVAQAMGDPMLLTALVGKAPQSAPQAAPARRILPALAAGLVLAVLGTGGWLWQQRPVRFETAAGPGMVQHLVDGSTVHLDGRSALNVRMKAHARELELTAGRGLFEVAHSPDRPFTVHSHDVAVTAVGTIFEVAQVGEATLVKVEQGRVRVQDGATTRYLDAGHGLRLSSGHEAQAFSFPAAPDGINDPWINAQGDRLDSVLARLSHATSQTITCDPVLANRPVSGRYRLNDPESSLRLMALANGWRVEATGQGWSLHPA